jgi:hypothetical protein
LDSSPGIGREEGVAKTLIFYEDTEFYDSNVSERDLKAFSIDA